MTLRQPAVAGMFYASDPQSLGEHMSRLFEGVKETPNCVGVVSPHAGYEYSGRTAAHAVSSLKPAKRFVVLGPNHYLAGHEFSIMSSGGWKTPLGECKIDAGMAEELGKCALLRENGAAHAREHSIEVQLPLLQHRFKSLEFVPISIMNTSYSPEFLKNCEELGRHIAGVVKKLGDAGIIASSDFTHYMPAREAKKLDDRAIEKILSLNAEGFFKTIDEDAASICGYGPIAVLMAAAKGMKLRARLIHYSTSGDATGDLGSVVAYCAIGFS